PERTLLVLCPAFRGRDEYPNLTVKKIPKQVLNRCEWGHDDYSLRVENLPKAPHPNPLPEGEGAKENGSSPPNGRGENARQQSLFSDSTEE
ncbi:MAG: site-specific DNA-methyltransferase, partial [Candidatus Competibacter sp.]|nr:site-specific DNA-methyltransferase [Candidatus Competibacter sp.]